MVRKIERIFGMPAFVFTELNELVSSEVPKWRAVAHAAFGDPVQGDTFLEKFLETLVDRVRVEHGPYRIYDISGEFLSCLEVHLRRLGVVRIHAGWAPEGSVDYDQFEIEARRFLGAAPRGESQDRRG